MTRGPESAAHCQFARRSDFRESPRHRGPSSWFSGRPFPLYLSLSGNGKGNAFRPPMPAEYRIQASSASLNGLSGAKKVES